MEKDKVETLTGFAVKAAKLIYGADNITKGRRKPLVMICATASENTRKEIERFCKRTGSDLIVTEKPLESIVHKTNCKAIAFKDAQMADAVKKNINENYILIVAEVKN